MSKEICQELLIGLKDRLEEVLDSERLDSIELASAYVDLGYINALVTYKVFIESTDYEALLDQVRSYEASIK